MSTYTVQDVLSSTERHKLYALFCLPKDLGSTILSIIQDGLPVVNIGKEVAGFLDNLEDYSYLSIDTYDFITRLLESRKASIAGMGNNCIAIYNLGALFEPTLDLNAVQLFKNFSKTAALIIVWENEADGNHILAWATDKERYKLDFSDIQLKKLQYAI